jgi:hypothetical protein
MNVIIPPDWINHKKVIDDFLGQLRHTIPEFMDHVGSALIRPILIRPFLTTGARKMLIKQDRVVFQTDKFDMNLHERIGGRVDGVDTMQANFLDLYVQ